jgi:hypothetical protein
MTILFWHRSSKRGSKHRTGPCSIARRGRRVVMYGKGSNIAPIYNARGMSKGTDSTIITIIIAPLFDQIIVVINITIMAVVTDLFAWTIVVIFVVWEPLDADCRDA